MNWNRFEYIIGSLVVYIILVAIAVYLFLELRSHFGREGFCLPRNDDTISKVRDAIVRVVNSGSNYNQFLKDVGAQNISPLKYSRLLKLAKRDALTKENIDTVLYADGQPTECLDNMPFGSLPLSSVKTIGGKKSKFREYPVTTQSRTVKPIGQNGYGSFIRQYSNTLIY